MDSGTPRMRALCATTRGRITTSSWRNVEEIYREHMSRSCYQVVFIQDQTLRRVQLFLPDGRGREDERDRTEVLLETEVEESQHGLALVAYTLYVV